MKVPPQDIAIEKEVLGAILLQPSHIINVSNIISSDCFYLNQNKAIWDSIMSLFRKNKPVDAITVLNELKSTSNDFAGSAVYLVGLSNDSMSGSNVEAHAHILKEKYLRRRLIDMQIRSVSLLYEDGVDVFDELNKIMGEIDAINSEISRMSQVTFYDAVASRVLELQEASKHNYKTGVVSGLSDIDRVTLGFQPSDLIILAGRPAMGKTALAVDMAKNQSKFGIPVGIFSLEMSINQLIDRILSSETEVDLGTIRKGGMNAQQWQRMNETTLRVMEYPMFVCDKGGLNINDIVTIAKGWKLKHNIGIIYIDYLQLISGSGQKGQNREQEVSDISRKLKALAKELNIPIIALSQLSRKCEERTDKRPMLSDLRESGAIEQDADMVIFPFCPSYYDENAERDLCEIIVAKYRNGKTGMVQIRFQKDIQKFSNLIKGPY
jgi:replicative DNA helicase